MLEVFKKVCEKWLKDNYNDNYSFTFRSQSVEYGRIYVNYILLHKVSEECCPVYDVQFISDGTIKTRRMFEVLENPFVNDFDDWKTYKF